MAGRGEAMVAASEATMEGAHAAMAVAMRKMMAEAMVMKGGYGGRQS